ncbi:MAG: hypothetical protein JWL72_3244, partial [Ilumatobacteraceae bacterium]|nr:hypothetical protein [Ilumatobacteraceae bacterium]
VAELGEQVDGLVDRGRCVVVERCWLDVRIPPANRLVPAKNIMSALYTGKVGAPISRASRFSAGRGGYNGGTVLVDRRNIG